MTRKETFMTLGVAALAGLVGGALTSLVVVSGPAFAQKDKVISAQKFAVVDADGKERGSFAVTDGTVSLALLGKEGQARGSFAAGVDGLTALTLTHKGQARARIEIEGNGNPSINLWDETGKVVFLQPK